jgi:hypothetical protein
MAMVVVFRFLPVFRFQFVVLPRFVPYGYLPVVDR